MTIPALDQNSARARTPQPATMTAPVEADVFDEDDEQPDQPPIPAIQADCAFVVYRQLDGRTIVTADLNAPVVARRPPTTHDVVGMCANAQDDVRAQATVPGIANAVAGEMMKVQQMMTNQAQEMAVRQQMEQDKFKRPGG
jgi:hypothetical protein